MAGSNAIAVRRLGLVMVVVVILHVLWFWNDHVDNYRSTASATRNRIETAVRTSTVSTSRTTTTSLTTAIPVAALPEDKERILRQGQCCESNPLNVSGLAFAKDCKFLAPKSVLLHNPPNIEGQLEPCLLLEWWDTSFSRDEEIQFSIIVNVFNHESTIAKVVTQIIKLTTEPFELILFFDGCTDDSIAEASAAVSEFINTPPTCNGSVDQRFSMDSGFTRCTYENGISLIHFRAIVQPANNSVFETTGNNIAMRASSGRYFVILQDDMYITQYAWNTVMASALRKYGDMVSVSAMCGHDLFEHGKNKIGMCGSVRKMLRSPSAIAGCNVYITQTSNRGPLMLDSAKALTLGLLDEFNIRMFNDDHDFHCRAYLDHGWVTGYIEIGFFVNIHEGGVRSTENKKRIRPQYETIFISRRNGRKNGKDCFWKRKQEYTTSVRTNNFSAHTRPVDLALRCQ